MRQVCEILFCFTFISIKFTEQYKGEVSNEDAVESYCNSFDTCKECKRASPQCDWCHEVGCTSFPNFHCPQKVYLDRKYKTPITERFCTEIVSTDPIFVPANIRKFISMHLAIDDLTIYKRNVICEIHIEETILRVKATLSESTLYCDMTLFRVSRSVSLGYIRLLWGGAEPYSNLILLIVYRCEYMASSCADCQVLTNNFNCGWCEETASCSSHEECPREHGPWINKKSLCNRYKEDLPYYIENKEHRE